MSTYAMPHVWPTVVHMLDDAARRAPQHTALVCGAEQFNYRQYAACVAGLAAELRQAGLGAGERVVVFMANSPDVAIAIFGVQAAGAQVVPMNSAYTASELKQVLENADARGIIYDEAASAVVNEVASGFALRYCIGSGPGAQRLVRWAGQPELADALPLPSPSEPAILQYTGGTTGVPKGVSLLHAAVSANISQREALVPTRAGQERVLAITPLFHSYSMAMGLYLAVYARSTLVILPRYRPDTVLEAIARERITLMLGSPTIFTGLMGFEGFAQADLNSLRLCASGSAALPEETLRRWEAATGCAVCEGYGQTEAGPVIAFNPLNGVRKSGTVGVPAPETEVQIVDVHDGDKVLPQGEVGEIRVRGPQLMTGYYGRPQETADALRGGWLYTGDIGQLDEEGYLTICDRKKEMAIVSGYNVYPREVEEALFRHPGVREAAVIGVPDDYRGEVLVAHVVADAGVTQETLAGFLAERLVKYKWPSVIHLVDSLPRTGVGKIDKKVLRAMAGKG
ncbi:long-chain-fatty-acid--CoA ligase [Pusillimonas noertemannii]|nr:long-chain fatty acid--CoA ligase [Pusillimonas noertemannii]NYT67199.1 long-chain fatty acid--CoA ligase [Pusillimonas noertemannii]TFL12605.1 long-chain fatty acid--CoA ligase [Pusillimonas noertemannii]